MSESVLPVPPAAWLAEHLDLVRAAQELGPVLDLACGRGRNALFLAQTGVSVVAIDRDLDNLRELESHAQRFAAPIHRVRCDLETRHGIPVLPGSCGAILVFRFLFRPLAKAIEDALKPGGVLVYETFAQAHRKTGRGPKRAEFYLALGELPALFPRLGVVSFAEGPDGGDPGDITARLVARKRG